MGISPRVYALKAEKGLEVGVVPRGVELFAFDVCLAAGVVVGCAVVGDAFGGAWVGQPVVLEQDVGARSGDSAGSPRAPLHQRAGTLA